MNRLASSFPYAEAYGDGKDGDRISVWCSNDYLGMGSHPELKKTVRYDLQMFLLLYMSRNDDRNLKETTNFE